MPRSRSSRKKKNHIHTKTIFTFLLVLAVIVLGVKHISAKTAAEVNKTPIKTAPAQTVLLPTKPLTPKPTITQCSYNYLDKLVVVSISARHVWACQGSSVVYDTPVVTGMEFLPADLTPVGTYHVYGKLTNLYLKGCDSTGCWNDYVSYFIEFLSNQYGVYGFHDATWRADSAFGNISPNSSDASHGCVEMPVGAATWLYNWAPVGTTITIIS